MRKIAVVFMLCFVATQVFAGTMNKSTEATNGKKLFMKILSRHPNIDKFYRKPYMFGALTATPYAAISVPMTDWEKLSTNNRNLLIAYARSLVTIVKADPLKYARVPKEAPAAPANQGKCS